MQTIAACDQVAIACNWQGIQLRVNSYMNTSIRTELKSYILDAVNDEVITDANIDDWHFHLFNEDYYIVGYYNAEQWLAQHQVSAFDAIADVIEWEREVIGEVTLTPEDTNSEKVVNLYVFIKGEELLAELGAESIDELSEALED